MNRRILITTLLATALITGCGLFTRAKPSNETANKTIKTQMASQNQIASDAPSLGKIEFIPGVSSVTVEKLASQNRCVSKQGAGQVTPKGPTEVYKVSCDDGRVFMAKCELRQCQPMMSK